MATVIRGSQTTKTYESQNVTVSTTEGDKVAIDVSLPAVTSDNPLASVITDPSSGNQANVTDGLVSTSDFFTEVAKGAVDNHTVWTTIAENLDIDTGTVPEDLWCYGGTYTFSSTADITQLSSANNTDTQLVTVYGLDENWLEVIQQKTLTGQTPVNLDTPLIRVNLVVNSDSTEILGPVYLTTNGASLVAGVPSLASTVRSTVHNANQISCVCVYSVPADRLAIINRGYVSYIKSSSTGATCSFRYRLFGEVFKVAAKATIIGNGTSIWIRSPLPPFVIPPKTDIKITCEQVDTNNTGLSGGFDLILKTIV